MKFDSRYRSIYFLLSAAAIMITYVMYSEIRTHYFEEYNGSVIEKQQIPPKKMPDLLIRGNNDPFPTWKWKGIKFDSVKIGDSIVKRKYESNAYYFRRLSNGKFEEKVLEYWFP